MKTKLSLAAAALWIAWQTSSANAAIAPAVVPQVKLMIGVIKDAGGLPAKSSETPLNVQLTHGLAKYIALHDFGRIYLTIPDMTTTGPKPAAGAPVYDLEGDFSHTQVDDPTGGPYLCVLRLFKVGTGRTLIDQWAGSAKTYSDLATNLHDTSNINPEGLVGSLGERVIAATLSSVHVDQTSKFAALIASGEALKRVTSSVVIQGDGQVLHSGDQYKIEVTSQDAGSVYLVSLDKSGKPASVFVPDAGSEIDVDAGRPVIVPGDSALSTGQVLGATDQTVVVLIRRQSSADTSIVRVSGAPDPNPPVKVLDAGPIVRSDAGSNDPGVGRILDMASKDPAGTWITGTVDVHIEPAAK